MSSRNLFAAVCCLVLGSSANAGALYQLTWTQRIEGIAIEITGTDTTSDGVTDIGNGSCVNVQPNRVQTTITCPTGLISASGSSVGTSYSVGLTMPLFALTTFTTGGIINFHTMASLIGSASIQGGPSAATANQGFGGMLTVKAAFHATFGANASMFVPFMTTLLKVPLGVGADGPQTGYFTVLGNYHYFTVDSYGWVPHSVSFTGLTSKFAPLPTPTVVAMGSVIQGPGYLIVTLVAPSKISIDGDIFQRRTASFTTLRLHYFPEPSALLLLASGAAAFGFARVHSNRRTP